MGSNTPANIMAMLLTVMLGALAIAHEAASEETASREETHAAAAAEDVTPLEAGDTVPDVEVSNLDGETVKLRDALASQPTVLIFYRGGWCPYCTTHLAEVAAAHDDLNALGFRVVGISADTPEAATATRAEKELPYTLLADPQMVAAQAFGLAFELDGVTATRYRIGGVPLGEKDSPRRNQLPVPAVYLIEGGEQIRFGHYEPDYAERLEGKAILEAARDIVNQSTTRDVSQIEDDES